MKLPSSTTELNGSNLKIAVLLPRFNDALGSILYKNTKERLLELQVKSENIQLTRVPGSLELPLAAKLLAEQKKFNVIIALGIVIKGETPHFDYVCGETYRGLMQVNLETGTPVIFGVITATTEKQVTDRVEKDRFNKGKDYAESDIEMAHMAHELHGK
ncbi:MAG TPA: 6,7-dimethyl-8-ribityllumazine synthase [Candidatus Gracilibacteria bacterium]|nr:6,7-dimethyl-8-ribityllumazine synthase [Candidatus Gracilibacteria bacterium]